MTARILIVDGIPANVKLLEARLLAEYFDVLTASDGEEALRICDKGHVDLVLLDIMMPGMDGFEVCERPMVWTTGSILLNCADQIVSIENSPVVSTEAPRVGWHADPLWATTIGYRLMLLLQSRRRRGGQTEGDRDDP